MLVLSRKIGERIAVPRCQRVVTVIAIKGNAVRLGIFAPEYIEVYREEVWHKRRQRTHRTAPRGYNMSEESGPPDPGNPRSAPSRALAPAPGSGLIGRGLTTEPRS